MRGIFWWLGNSIKSSTHLLSIMLGDFASSKREICWSSAMFAGSVAACRTIKEMLF